MKTSYTTLLAVLLILPMYELASQTPVRVGAYNFAPLVSIEDGKPQGLFIDLTDEIARRENWNVEYVAGSWQESMEAIKTGSIDILVAIGYSEVRAAYLDFSNQAVYGDSGVLYVRKGSAISTSYDLAGRTVAHLQGALISEGFKTYIMNLGVECTFKEYREVEDVMKAVAEGSVDAGIFTHLQGTALARRYSTAETSIIFSPVSITYATTKGRNEMLLAAINRQLRSLKEDPQSLYYSSYARWINHEHPYSPPPWLWILIGFISLLLVSLFGLTTFMRRQVRLKTLELRQANTDLSNAQRYAHVGSWTWDIARGSLTWSDEMYRLFGIEKKNFTGILTDVVSMSIHPDDREKVAAANRQVAENGKPVPLEYRIILPNASVHTVWAEAGSMETDAGAKPVRLSGYVQDISERKKAELELLALLRDKETLLRELYHRTKNNMYLISSLMELRAESLPEQATKAAFVEMRARIDAMALIHEMLYKAKNLTEINLGEYLSRLAEKHSEAFGSKIGRIFINTDFSGGKLALDVAVPLSMALNEILLNSFKHAFPEGRRGVIRMLSRFMEDGSLRIEMTDDGVGYPSGFDPDTSTSLGLTLIKSIIEEQLAGTLIRSGPPGVSYSIALPLAR